MKKILVALLVMMALSGCQEKANEQEPVVNSNKEDIVLHSEDLNTETNEVEMVDVDLEILTSNIKETIENVKVDYEVMEDGYTKMVVKDNEDREIVMAKFVSQLPKGMSLNATGSFLHDGKYTILLNYGVPNPIEGYEDQQALAYSYTLTERLDMCEGNPGNVYQTETYCVIASPGGYDTDLEEVKIMDEFIKNTELVKFE
ncbi:MAG: membrane lipoprotein lipid attachment site-containing protein [Erysipelotrichaceae bacterium]|nr:membrane lipoprotein lipid attachment site-containing protein [Erysipelotrichaceae bacterium]